MFNFKDDQNGEELFSEVDYSMKSSRVHWFLRLIVNKFGAP